MSDSRSWVDRLFQTQWRSSARYSGRRSCSVLLTALHTRGDLFFESLKFYCFTIVSSFVWTQYRSVTDGRTDKISLAITALCIASNADALNQSINQSINARFAWRRYTTRPGAPTVVSYKHDQKVHS